MLNSTNGIGFKMFCSQFMLSSGIRILDRVYGFPMFRSFLALGPVALLFIFSLNGCSNGTVSVTEEKAFDAETALHLLEVASSAEEIDHALGRIETNTSQKFDWIYFWQGLDKRTVMPKLGKADQERVFSMHALSCRTDHFQAFGEFAEKLDTGFPFLLKPLKKCANPLSDSTIDRIIRKFDGEIKNETDTKVVEEKSTALTNFLVSETSQNGEHDWKSSLDTLLPTTWEKVAKSLAGKDAPSQADPGSDSNSAGKKHSLFLNLTQLHLKKRGNLDFMEPAVGVILKSADAFKLFLKQIRYPALLQLLLNAKESLFSDLTQDQFEQLFDRLNQAYSAELSRIRPSANATQEVASAFFKTGWDLLIDLRQVERNVHSLHKTKHALVWLEGLHRIYEEELLKLIRFAPAFLDTLPAEFSYQNADAFWIRFRIQQRLENTTLAAISELSEIKTATSMSLLDRVLSFRLNAYFHPSTETIQAFCDELEKDDILPTKVPVDQLDTISKLLGNSGCIFVEGAKPGDEHHFKGVDVKMAYDSAVIAPDLNLFWETNLFDGALFDLSSQTFHTDLPDEPPLEGDSALVVPLLVGIQMTDKTFLRGEGSYYFIFHHVIRRATNGREASAIALKGNPGGNIEITVPAAREKSLELFKPTLVSNGGPGQKAAPARKGGDGDVSRIDRATCKLFTSQMEARGKVSETTKPIDRFYFIEKPSTRTLQTLFRYGVKKPSAQNVPESVQGIVEENTAYLHAQKNEKQINAISELRLQRPIYKQQIDRSLNEIEGILASDINPDNYFIPEIGSYSYEVIAGDLGLTGTDGAQGETGTLDLKVK